MEILHHGDVNGVTGSCHEVRTESSGILIDCGLFQGAEVSKSGSSFEQLKIDFPINHIKALIVTHVHIDHGGRIPYLIAAGFRGPIYCSEPSAKLLPLVLEHVAKISFAGDSVLIESFLQCIRGKQKTLTYENWLRIAGECDEYHIKPDGYILGSAYV